MFMESVPGSCGISTLWQNAGIRDLMEELHTCDGERALEISQSLSQAIAAERSGNVADFQAPDNWVEVYRNDAMRAVLGEKFERNPGFQRFFMATEEAYLLAHDEVVPEENYWSDGHDGTGANALGKMLMEIRDRTKPADDPGVIQAHAVFLNGLEPLPYPIF